MMFKAIVACLSLVGFVLAQDSCESVCKSYEFEAGIDGSNFTNCLCTINKITNDFCQFQINDDLDLEKADCHFACSANYNHEKDEEGAVSKNCFEGDCVPKGEGYKCQCSCKKT